MKKIVFLNVMTVMVLVASMAALEVAAAPAQAGTATIAIDPSPVTTIAEASFAVQAMVTATDGGDGDVQGANIYINFDPAFLQVTSAAAVSPFVAPGGAVIDNVAGTVSAPCGSLSGAQAVPVALLNIEFAVQAGAAGQSMIAFGGATKVAGSTQDYATTNTVDGVVVVPAEQTLTVNVAPAGAVAAGANVARNPAPPYMTMDVVELTASSPDPCWTFVDWTGDLMTTTNPVNITLDADKEVTATFEAPLFNLTINTVGNGAVAANPDKPGGYDCGEDVELTANPAANARFVEWSGDLTGSDNPDTISMDGARSVTATFVDVVDLTFNPAPTGGTVTVMEENPDGNYDVGETITITAAADYCYEFDGWTGDLAGESNPAVVVLAADLTFEATFVVPDYTLTVDIVNDEGVTGTVTLDPTGGTYACGKVVTLTATWDGMGVFSAWSGDLTGSDNPDTITVDSDKVVTATFLGKIIWTFDPDQDGGTIVPEPDYPPDGYDPNTVVTVTAVPDPCYQFVGWTGALAGEPNPAIVTADAPLSFGADFSLITHTTVITGVVGQGSMDFMPKSASYACGDTITVTATAATLWAFDQWSGTVTFTDASAETTQAVIGEAAPTVTAHFVQYKIYLPLVVRNS